MFKRTKVSSRTYSNVTDILKKYELIEEIKRVDPARFIQVKLTNKGLDIAQRLFEIREIIEGKDS